MLANKIQMEPSMELLIVFEHVLRKAINLMSFKDLDGC